MSVHTAESDVPEYGSIMITQKRLIVDEAPDLSLISIELLRDMKPPIANGDRLSIGFDADGNHIVYRIIGWEPGQKALIVRRWPSDKDGE